MITCNLIQLLHVFYLIYPIVFSGENNIKVPTQLTQKTLDLKLGGLNQIEEVTNQTYVKLKREFQSQQQETLDLICISA